MNRFRSSPRPNRFILSGPQMLINSGLNGANKTSNVVKPVNSTPHIGLRSTGLVVFAGRVISAATGLLFTVMVARWLIPQQLGLWEVIIDLVTFSAYPVGVVAFWATRDVARGKMVGRTALAMGGVMSGAGLVIYAAFTLVTTQSLAASVVPFLLGALLVPLSYWSAVANSIVQGHRPAVYGYSLVISEVAKLIVAYAALYVYRMGINGVILALITSYFVQSAVSTYAVKVTVSEPLDRQQARRWTKLAWLPAISYLPTVVAIADTYVASLGFGTSITGYYQVAYTVASVVGYSSGLAFSLYPMLLRGGGDRLPAITIEFSLLFCIPMAVGGVVLAQPILFLFGKTYLPGAEGLSILAVSFVFTTISGIVDQTLLGTEKADHRERTSFWELARSNLLFVPVANVLWAGVYLASMYLALSYSFSHGYPTSVAVALWAAAQLVSTAAFMLVKARRAAKSARLVPGRSVVYYLIAAAVMGISVYLLAGAMVDQALDTVMYGLRLVGVVLAGTGLYFGLVYSMDGEFRRMARSLLS